MTTNSGPDIHFTALCNAIEHEKLEKTKAILETHPSLHLDSANNDGFTPLDLAFMTGNKDILSLLINHRPDEQSGKSLSKTLLVSFSLILVCSLKILTFRSNFKLCSP